MRSKSPRPSAGNKDRRGFHSKPSQGPSKPQGRAKPQSHGKPSGHANPQGSKPHGSKPQGHGKPQGHAKPHGQFKPQGQPRPQPRQEAARPGKPNRTENWLYGLHAVRAALANPARKLGRLLVTARVAEIIGEEHPDHIRVEIMEPGAIDKLLPPGAVHQGAALEAAPLRGADLEAILAQPAPGRRRVILVLDHLSDPHNVGAILRSAAAFGVHAVVVQDRHAPPQSGALAKAASGALDLVPYVEVVNIARAMDQMAEHGFWRIALAGDGAETLQAAIPAGDVALVLGSEGDGVRRLVREHCDTAAHIPMDGGMESLNVSNAAAIALYAVRSGTSG